jgi:hypothetical protein
VPPWLASSSLWTLIICVTIFFLLLLLPIMEKAEQQNCLAMLVFVSLLWATEVSLHDSSRLNRQDANSFIDYSSLCHFITDSLPLCRPTCCPRRDARQASEAS